MPVDRSRLPQPGAPPDFRFPDVRQTTLDNGLNLWTVEHHAVPLISVLLLVRRGSAADPPDRHGLAAITGDLLDDGAGEFDALGFHEALGRIGAQVDTEVSADATMLALSVLRRYASRGVSLLADMVQRPRFTVQDFERVRDLRLNRLVQIRDLPQALADRAFTELLYRDHPYGHLAIGREESIRAISVDEVRNFHATSFAPAGVTIVAAGDASHGELAALVRESFDGWNGDGAVSPPEISYPSEPASRLAVLPRPAAPQSELRIGHVSIARLDPDYFRLLALNMVLGGQFVSRVNMNLREKRGYTYGARTSFDARRGPGPFVLQASVQADATGDAIHQAMKEIEDVRGARPVTELELDTGRAALTRGYARNFETAEQVARAAAQIAVHDLPGDYYTTFVSRVLAISPDDVTAAAERHLRPERMTTVVVGDQDRIASGLEALYLGTALELQP
jgi:predicted Zn-dependent peptidase